MSVTIKITAFKEPRIDGSLPVKLRVICDRKIRYFSLSRYVMPKNWEESAGRFSRGHAGWREENTRLVEFEQRAAAAVRKFEMERQVFTFERFKEEVFGVAASNAVAWAYIAGLSDEMKEAGRLGNAAVYHHCSNRVRAFRPKAVLADIDRVWLAAFEKFLLQSAKGGGASVIMRTLRAACKTAERNGQMPRGWAPFGDFGISHLKGRGIKKALALADIRRLESAKAPEALQLSVDLFLLSFYLRGANMADMAEIKHSDISAGRMVYYRKKTGGRISVAISDRAQSIIEKYRIPGEKYAFPILDSLAHKSAAQIRERVRKLLRRVNREIKEVAGGMGINTENLTFYSARHSYATALDREGVSRAVISQALGHSSVKTTEIYLAAFGDSVVDEADGLLG